MVFFRSNHLDGVEFPKEQELDYQQIVRQLKDQWVEEEERKIFEHNADLEFVTSRMSQTGHVSFVLYNVNHEIERYSYSWLDLDHNFLLFVMEDLTREMETDYLTGYLNRRGFYRRAEKVITDDWQKDYAILFINIMHFKAVNDRLGQEKADEVLRKTILRLRNSYLKPVVITIIEMAHRLGMQVIAEGIETVEQAEFLKKNHCDYFQGYYYAKPMSQREFEALLEKQSEKKMA